MCEVGGCHVVWVVPVGCCSQLHPAVSVCCDYICSLWRGSFGHVVACILCFLACFVFRGYSSIVKTLDHPSRGPRVLVRADNYCVSL